MATGWRNRLKRTLWPLFWPAGLGLIAYYAPASYRTLQLGDGEQVIGFRGSSYDLITVTGGVPPPPLAADAWSPISRTKWHRMSLKRHRFRRAVTSLVVSWGKRRKSETLYRTSSYINRL